MRGVDIKKKATKVVVKILVLNSGDSIAVVWYIIYTTFVFFSSFLYI